MQDWGRSGALAEIQMRAVSVHWGVSTFAETRQERESTGERLIMLGWANQRQLATEWLGCYNADAITVSIVTVYFVHPPSQDSPMPKLTLPQVEHVALLARLELTPEEKEKLT